MKIKSIGKYLVNLSVSACALGLVACGGGGGGSGGSTPTPQAPSTPLSIDAANSKQIAGEVVKTTITTSEASTFVGVELDAGSGMTLTEINRKISELVSDRDLGTRFVSGVVIACSQGGSLTAPDNSFVGVYQFNNCAEPGVTTNGSLTVSGTGDFINNFSGSFAYTAFTITTSLGSDTIDGTINTSWTDSGSLLTGNVNTPLLSFVSGSEFFDLVNFNNDYSWSNANSVETETIAYTLNSSLLNGQVSLTTTTPIQTFFTRLYPFAGQVICTGANNSKIRVTVNQGGIGVETDTITIETDANGDDIYEGSEVVMWSEL